MFNKIITAVRTTIAKYKAQRVKDVVTEYVSIADAQVVTCVPTALEFYRDAAHIIVDKTFENPEPALKLIEALDAVAKHYGPELKELTNSAVTKLEAQGASPAVTKRIEAFVKALETMREDVNVH